MMDDLIAFITARLDEDEVVARSAASLQADPENGWGIDGRAITPHIGVVHEEESRVHIARHNPARVLREVEAKRAIVRRCGWSVNEPDRYPNGLVSPRAVLARQNLSDLAAAWNDHPDYRAEWKL
jgi:Family of unknown function (DUF6221)